MISPIFCQTNFMTYEHNNVHRCRHVDFRNNIWKFYRKRSFKCSQNFYVLQLQAAITLQWLQTAGNSLPNWPSTGRLVSVSIFTIRMNSVFTLGFAFCTRYLPKFSATSDVRNCALKPMVCRRAQLLYGHAYQGVVCHPKANTWYILPILNILVFL